MSFFISKNGRKKQGPLSLEAITKLIFEESLKKEDLVWREGLDDWMPAGELPDLKKIFKSQPPPLNPKKREYFGTSRQGGEGNERLKADFISTPNLTEIGKKYGGVTIYFLLLWLIYYAWQIEDSMAYLEAGKSAYDKGLLIRMVLAESFGAALAASGFSYIITRAISYAIAGNKEILWGARLIFTAFFLWVTLPDLSDDSRLDFTRRQSEIEEMERVIEKMDGENNQREQFIGGKRHRVIPVPQ